MVDGFKSILYLLFKKRNSSPVFEYASGVREYAGDRHVSAGERHVSAGERHVSAEERHVSAEERHVSAEERHVSAEERHVSAEDIPVSADSVYRVAKAVFASPVGVNNTVNDSFESVLAVRRPDVSKFVLNLILSCYFDLRPLRQAFFIKKAIPPFIPLCVSIA
jgi:hypothetical protein